MRCILDKARETGGHVTIDMESTAYTDATLRVFRTPARTMTTSAS